MPRVLIFEDDEFLREMYRQKFSKSGFTVDVRAEASKAVADAGEVKPDIILMDLIMPKIDGFEATKKLMSDPDTSAIPVLIVSNLGDEATIQKALWYGAKDVVMKSSLTPDMLVKKTKETLAGKPSEHVLNPQLINILHIDALARPKRK